MIITGLLTLVRVFLSALFALLPALPALPAEVTSTVGSMLEYIGLGSSILLQFFDIALVRVLVSSWLAVFTLYHGYQFVMFVLRKIPMLGIE